MTDARAMQLIRGHLESTFPKTCTMCARVFPTFRDYLLGSKPVGDPISYDADHGDWRPTRPVGTFALATCTCGTTLALGSEGMPTLTLIRLMFWARGKAHERGIGFRALLAEIRRDLTVETLGADHAP